MCVDLASVNDTDVKDTLVSLTTNTVLMKSASESQLPMLPPSLIPLTETLPQFHERHSLSSDTTFGLSSAPITQSIAGSTPTINLDPPVNEARPRNTMHSTSDTMLLSRTMGSGRPQDSPPASLLASSRSSNGSNSGGGAVKDGDLRKGGIGSALSKSFTRFGRVMKQTKRDLLDVHDDEETDGMSLKSSLSSDEDEESFQIIQVCMAVTGVYGGL